MLHPQVVHETLDGETVVINLESGTYYSLEGTAADLWDRLLNGEPAAESARDLAAGAGADRDAVHAAVVAFHRELHAEGLLVVPPQSAPVGEGSLGSFAKPEVRAYTDLREHLLLDPVHDVERGSGWPVTTSGP